MKPILSLQLWLLVFLFLAVAGGMEAATLRGAIVRVGPMGVFPVGGVAVTVNHSQFGRSPPAYTRPDGMYYLTLPAGSYTLEIWISPDPRVPPMRMSIIVREPYTDIAPIRLP